MYATTKIFLDYFNLKSLDQLPPLAEIQDLDNLTAELGLEVVDDVSEKEILENSQQQTDSNVNDEASLDEQAVETASSRVTDNDSSSLFSEDYVDSSNMAESSERSTEDTSADDNVVALPITNSSDK
jgi:segregation and condensation protein B